MLQSMICIFQQLIFITSFNAVALYLDIAGKLYLRSDLSQLMKLYRYACQRRPVNIRIIIVSVI